MAKPSSSGGSSELNVSLKRKRSFTDSEDTENVPPSKKSVSYDSDTDAITTLLLEEPSPYDSTSDEEGGQQLTVVPDPCKSYGGESEEEYPVDLFSPPSDLPSGVLSPLDNVVRGDSTPHSSKRHCKSDVVSPVRKCPLPGLSWADPVDVWNRMCESDLRFWKKRNPAMFAQHPGLQHRMRAILIDWLNEVCEVYKMHRETFHLAVDYVDRYLSNTEDVPKNRLQLIGITCLFIAAKVEEIYPPKINEFAYVTDGACTTDDILQEEIGILKVLQWSITPVTINGWLNVYMQLASESKGARKRILNESDSLINSLRGYTFVFPQYSSMEFSSCAQVIDLAVLHVSVNMFPYSVVAAATMAHNFTKESAMIVSGYSWEELEACYKYLAPLVTTVRSESQSVRVMPHADADFIPCNGGLQRICPDLNTDDSHRIQVHNITLDMFDIVNPDLTDMSDNLRTSLEPCSSNSYPAWPLTPPCSNHKHELTPQNPTPKSRTAIDDSPDVCK